MAFDPYGSDLWVTENGDDTFSEINRVEGGSNGGWIQIMGPQHRFFDYKEIEVNQFGGALQQVRFRPTRLADDPGDARETLFMLPGAKYMDPELSWKYESGPAGTAFVRGTALGAENEGTLWFGSSRAFQQVGGTGGSIYRVRLNQNRKKLDVSDPNLAERVVDNTVKFGTEESESIIVGEGFGTTPDIQQGPDGNLYVVSITDSAIYKISKQ
jgi:glucose/arabinose dehydrogenase